MGQSKSERDRSLVINLTDTVGVAVIRIEGLKGILAALAESPHEIKGGEFYVLLDALCNMSEKLSRAATPLERDVLGEVRS